MHTADQRKQSSRGNPKPAQRQHENHPGRTTSLTTSKQHCPFATEHDTHLPESTDPKIYMTTTTTAKSQTHADEQEAKLEFQYADCVCFVCTKGLCVTIALLPPVPQCPRLPPHSIPSPTKKLPHLRKEHLPRVLNHLLDAHEESDSFTAVKLSLIHI